MGEYLEDKDVKKIPLSEIDKIVEEFKERRTGVEIEVKEGSLELKSGPKFFKIHEDGRITGSMPLHKFETRKAEMIELRKDELKVHFDGGTYTFKI